MKARAWSARILVVSLVLMGGLLLGRRSEIFAQEVVQRASSQTTITLAWDAVTTDKAGKPLTNLGGYKLSHGTKSKVYSKTIDVKNVTTYTVTGLTPGVTYFFAVSAYTTSGVESPKSLEASGATAPALTCPAPAVNAFTGCYYNNSDFSNLVMIRKDARIDFSWGKGAPSPLMAPDSFSVRWVGDWTLPAAGTYRVTASTDDGMRVWVDGTLLLESWKDQPTRTMTATISLKPGAHRIRVDYYEAGAGAVAKLAWSNETPTFDFAMSAVLSQSVNPGQRRVVSIPVTLVKGEPAPVTVDVTGLPDTVTDDLVPQSCLPPCTVGLTLGASTEAMPGVIPLKVVGSAGALRHQTTFDLTVLALPQSPPRPPTSVALVE